MSIVPETSNRSDWPRLVSQTVNRATTAIAAILPRLTAAETDLTAAEGDITALDGRVTALEGETAYTVATITYTPSATPGTPVAGMTYFDSGTNKLRTWDGSAWNDHW